jgi:hypothetical protein
MTSQTGLKVFSGLNSQTYEHPFDKQALASLRKMPGISTILKKINEYSIDRLLRLQTLGSEIRVTNRNFPKLYQALVTACEVLDVSPLPELYLFRGTGYIQSYIIGVEKPLIGVNLEAMEWLNSQELLYLIGSEIARIKSQNVVYHQMAIVMPNIKNLLISTTLGIGGLVASGVELSLYNWLMMSKLTADRAGLLACQNINVATNTLMKMAGLPQEYLNDDVMNDFIIQSREFASNNLDTLDKITKILSYAEPKLSWIIMRTGELLKWYDSGAYDSLIQGNFTSSDYVPKTEEVEDLDGMQNTEDRDQIKHPQNQQNNQTGSEDWNFISSW